MDLVCSGAGQERGDAHVGGCARQADGCRGGSPLSVCFGPIDTILGSATVNRQVCWANTEKKGALEFLIGLVFGFVLLVCLGQ